MLGLATTGCGRGTDAPTVAGMAAPPARVSAEQLPTLHLTTQNGGAVTSREVYVPGMFKLTDTLGRPQFEGSVEVKGRGNSTWDMPKKPYRLKLAASTPLLSMPASRHWVLLANYSDKTLLRNDIAFELSRNLGMDYTPRSQFIDLVMNGSYQGVYQLAEQIRVATERVNIPELKATDTSAAAITGGYLIEVDERRGEAFCFNSTATPMVFCLSNPETLLDASRSRQRDYIQGYIRQVDASIFGPQFTDPARGYAAYIDVESAISYYLVNELFKNVDGNLRLSTYLYKTRGGKLTFGPIWDFDLAIGNVNYNGADVAQGWHIRTAPWFARMFEDPAFLSRVKARWSEMNADHTLEKLLLYIRTRRDYLAKVQVRNFERWPILSTYVWPNRVVTGSYDAEVLAMEDWLWVRMGWLDAQFAR